MSITWKKYQRTHTTRLRGDIHLMRSPNTSEVSSPLDPFAVEQPPCALGRKEGGREGARKKKKGCNEFIRSGGACCRKEERSNGGGRQGAEAVESKFAFLWAARSGTEKGGRGESHLKALKGVKARRHFRREFFPNFSRKLKFCEDFNPAATRRALKLHFSASAART